MQSVEEIWNGRQAQDIRRSILDGSFEYCNRARCPYLQTVSGPVQPVDEVTNERMRALIDANATLLPYGPPKIICTYDQSCNLSCPSCRTRVIVENGAHGEIIGIQRKLQAEALREAEFLHMTGSGDPFGSPFFRKWLQTMEKAQMPKLERIHLQSNGLLWTRRMWQTISTDVQRLIRSAEISMDAATPGTYAINRRGGNFRKLLQNLEFISELRSEGPLEYVKISMVVQANNFREMPDLIAIGTRLGFDVVYFSQLVNWGTFSGEEFARRAVHIPLHPRHDEFLDLLRNPVFEQPIVDLGNLTDASRAATSETPAQLP